jgi:hypothetical protein
MSSLTTAPVSHRQANRLAITSLVFSILWIFGVGSILAIITGHIARHQVRKSDGTETGKHLAFFALLIAYVGLIIGVAYMGVMLLVSNDR